MAHFCGGFYVKQARWSREISGGERSQPVQVRSGFAGHLGGVDQNGQLIVAGKGTMAEVVATDENKAVVDDRCLDVGGAAGVVKQHLHPATPQITGSLVVVP